MIDKGLAPDPTEPPPGLDEGDEDGEDGGKSGGKSGGVVSDVGWEG